VVVVACAGVGGGTCDGFGAAFVVAGFAGDPAVFTRAAVVVVVAVVVAA